MTYFGTNAFMKVPVELYNTLYYVHCPATAKSISIPNTVKYIYDYACQGCSELSAITLPDGLISFGVGAFSGSSSLAEMAIPKGMTEIPGNAFSGSGLKSFKSPQNVTRICQRAFAGCEKLETIELSDGLNSIGEYAFSKCIALKEVNIPNSVTYVERNAFSHNPSLEKATISNTLTSIPLGMFSFDTALHVIDIPASVTQLGAAFWGCEALETVILHTAPPATVQSDAYTCFMNSACLFFVPNEHIEAYKSDTSWSTVADRIRGISELSDAGK